MRQVSVQTYKLLIIKAIYIAKVDNDITIYVLSYYVILLPVVHHSIHPRFRINIDSTANANPNCRGGNIKVPIWAKNKSSVLYMIRIM